MLSPPVGGIVGDYAANHGDLSPGLSGKETDFTNPGQGTGVIVTAGPLTQRTSSGRSYTGAWRDKVRMSNLRDGSSNTFLAGEMHVYQKHLNKSPYNGPVLNGVEMDNHSRIGGPGIPLLSSSEQAGFLLGFGSAHPNICNFVYADGSTRSLNNSLDTLVLANLCHRADGEVVGADY